MKRKRCPFCNRLTAEDLRQHIIEEHFGRVCSKCMLPEGKHPKIKTSPEYTMPCEAGRFLPLVQ